MILVGTIHIDDKGPARLERLLEILKPSVISVEYPAGVSVEEAKRTNEEYRSTALRILDGLSLPPNMRHLFLGPIQTAGYEILTPIYYAERNAAAIHFVDHPGTRKPVANEWESHYSEFVRTMVSQMNESDVYDPSTKQAAVDEAYFNTARLDILLGALGDELADCIEMLQESPAEDFFQKRENFMAEQIRSISPDVHIGGLGHIFDFSEAYPISVPLYKLLEGEYKQRIRLCEADSISP